ncbi:MAG: hypothetical protein Tsb0027_06960 [Wenzhouxiangellaceae bacterium]
MQLFKHLIILSALILAGTALAQTGQQFLTEIQQSAQIVQTRYATAQSMLSIAEMAGDAQAYQLAQYELQYNQQVYAHLQQLAQNPAALADPAAYEDFQNGMWEYHYRSSQRDYRPYEQITANLQAYVAQRTWEISTPEGRQAYQARQQGNQAAFDAHQRNMAQRSAMMDQNHAGFMNNLRNTPSRPVDSDYDSHDAFIDGIHDSTSFQDPYSGRQITQDGDYDYWYQDNLGNYYGTDDPGFDPHSLQGNWERIEPLRPRQ